MKNTKRILLFTLDRGFVVIGYAELDPQYAYHWLVSPCRTIRTWGTTQGLSELAQGPTANTVLDPPVTEHIPFRSIIKFMEVKEEKWKKHLTGD